jgi:hypothetical protein
MSRPRVNGPRSLIVTTVEAPVRGFVSFTRVPNGNFLCAAVRPSGRNAWPLAVPEPSLYWVAFIEPLRQLPWVGAAMATLPNQVETRSKWIASMSLIAMIDLPLRLTGDGLYSPASCAFNRLCPIADIIDLDRKHPTFLV